METTGIDELGKLGLVADKEPSTLPPQAWSSFSNIRCEDRSIVSFLGHENIDSISIHPQTINFVKTGVKTFIVYAENKTIYAYTAGTETDISQYDYSSGGYWDSTILGGVCILNNAVQNPQYWGGEGLCVDLPYDSTGDITCTWTDVGMTARIIRSFRYHLFAFDIDDCNGRNTRRVWWSHPAEPGSLPITWDITKPEYEAGDAELSETPGRILDALPLRDTLQIYKEDAIYAATYTGAFDGNIFNFRLVTTSKGIYARNCVCDVNGRHFFVADGDIYVYDGTNFQSIADERVKNLFFEGVSRTFYYRTFCVYYQRTGEVWLCYPEAGYTHCNKALVWDSNGNTWSEKDIPESACGIFTVVDRESEYIWTDIGSGAYANQTGILYDTWADWGTNPISPAWTIWADPVDTSPIHDSLVLAGDGFLFEMDKGNTANGTNITCTAERTHLDLGDKADFHMIARVRVHAEGDSFNVQIGSQNHINEAVTWADAQAFDPSSDYVLYFRVTGRLHTIRFTSTADVNWKVSAYEVDYAVVGRR